MPTLLMSSRHTDDDQALWRAAIGRGWSVSRARGLRLPEMEDGEIVLYVESLFAPSIAKLIGRELLDPPDDWLVQLPFDFVKRCIRLSTLGEARATCEQEFVKPPNDKSFTAQVYESGATLPGAFDDDMKVLIADPVKWKQNFVASVWMAT